MLKLYSCPFRDVRRTCDAADVEFEYAESWLWGNYFKKMGFEKSRDFLLEDVYVVDTAKYKIFFARESFLYLDRYIEYMTKPWLLLLTRIVMPRHYHATQMSCICKHTFIRRVYREMVSRKVL